MDGREFVERLRNENDFLLAKLDVPPVLSGLALEGRGGAMAPLAALLKMALKNEMEAAVIAAEWVASTPEIEAKLAFACHAGDEARHYQILEEKARVLGVHLQGFDPLSPESPVLTYLRSLKTTVERVAAALVAREAMGRRRNIQFLKFLEAVGQKEIARLYQDVINPDEDKHHRAGCAVLAKLALTPPAQEQARRACKRLLEIGDQARTLTMERTGAPVVPGC
jgi:1,2-phenylacetyl-CoA epoxidase catalytic subunit